jgi:hypothetical protein
MTVPEDGIRWEDPPPAYAKTRLMGKFVPVAAQLRARPGVWAMIEAGVTTANAGAIGTALRKGHRGFAPAGAIEVVSRSRPDGLSDLYARYVGEPS